GWAKGEGGAGACGTNPGAVGGPRAYMAPEQAGGGQAGVGPAADVYALGSILYELLTGRCPFLGDTPLEVLQQARADDPLPPRRLRPGVPRDLETICLKCLHKEPKKRYSSALALADDLRRFLDGEPISARRASPWERAVKWGRRRPTAAALVAVSAAAVLGLLGLILGYNVHLQARVRQAVANVQEAERDKQ